MANKPICDYCGEFPGNIQRPSPNPDEEKMWNVCATCDKMIKQQMKLSLGQILNMYGGDGDKIIKEATDEIAKLSHEAGIEMSCVKLQLKD